MSERQETMHVVVRYKIGCRKTQPGVPVKVFDDRVDARKFCKRNNLRSTKFDYFTYPVKCG